MPGFFLLVPIDSPSSAIHFFKVNIADPAVKKLRREKTPVLICNIYTVFVCFFTTLANQFLQVYARPGNSFLVPGQFFDNNLEWVNVNLENNFITVTALEAKSKRVRRIPINSELRKLFLKLKLTRNDDRYVLQNPMTGNAYGSFQGSWKSLLSRTGIEDLKFHDLRHTFASHFLMNGGDLYTLKEILGHKELNTTARYLTITTVQLFTRPKQWKYSRYRKLSRILSTFREQLKRV